MKNLSLIMLKIFMKLDVAIIICIYNGHYENCNVDEQFHCMMNNHHHHHFIIKNIIQEI